MINRLLMCFVLFLFTALLLGQKRYSGTVYDLGTHKKVNGLAVKALPSGIEEDTNADGYFSIVLDTEIPEEEKKDQYSILNNTLYWDLSAKVRIRVIDLNGRTIIHKTQSSNGSLSLPDLSAGYYILVLNYSGNAVMNKLFSDGQSVRLTVEQSKSDGNKEVPDSSLILSKVGYFTEELHLNDLDPIIEYGVLKKTYEDLNYFNDLRRYEGFYMLQSSPPVTNFGEVESIKALYDFEKDEIYYSNVKKYPSHFSFAKVHLDYKLGSYDFLFSQYTNHPSKYLHLVTINYHKTIDKYVFEFASVDLVSCDEVYATYQKILETSYFGDKLYFYANNQRWENCTDIPAISSEELYEGQNYQALNLAEGYGYLKKVEVEKLYETAPGPHEIILLNGIPNDVSVVSGIITTEFQSPLSHINVLSHNRNTPNMALKDAWTNTTLDELMGKLVYLKVGRDSFIIRSASLDEAQTFWAKTEPQVSQVLEMDTVTDGLIDLHKAGVKWVKTIGGKAANFSEMVKLGSIQLPEVSFAIPFHYYQQHISGNGIGSFINQMLKNEQFKLDQTYRHSMLDTLMSRIKKAPLDPALLELVENKIDHFKDFPAFRFRSSTNAEDLEYFSGAGIYDSFSAKKNHDSKTIENAIKKVWASLWNPRAFEERDYYKIDHKSVAMGILVHRSFPDEDANGVVITKNLYNVNHGYTINVQYKEHSIVYPEPGILSDLVLAYTINLEGSRYTFEYLTHSNVPELQGQPVLSKEELEKLSDYASILKQHYYSNVSGKFDIPYNDYSVDIEFKVDSQVESGKLYIKQVRIYNSL